jgi:hypothetical protein
VETPNRDTYQRLATVADNRRAAVMVAKSAGRDLALFSRDLEPLVYDTEEFVAVVQALAIRSRFTRVRIVTVDPGPSVRSGHRLIALAQRFSSYIEIRRASADHSTISETFMIADEAGILYRPVASQYEGFADTEAALDARLHLRTFNGIWDQAEPDAEFRRLGI